MRLAISMKPITIALLASVALTSCSPQSTPLLIGVAGPWTRDIGVATRQGIELAINEVNAAGGVRGRKVQAVIRDDGGNGARAAEIAQELVNDGVLGVIGHVNSGPTIAAAKVYDGHVAMIATSATSPALSGLSPWAFRVIASDSINGDMIARFATRLGHKRAAIIYENDSYGRGLMDTFRSHFRGEIVALDPMVADPDDFEPYVAYYRQVGPDLVFVAGTERSGRAFLREAKRQGLDAAFLGGDGWAGVVADPGAAEGAFIGTPFTVSDTRPAARRFVEAYRARYGTDPDANAALAYDATMLVAAAIAAVGPDRAAIRDYLAGLTEATAHQGVTGPIHFDENGDPVGKSFVMTRVTGGVLTPEVDR